MKNFPLDILISPSDFKECLEPDAVADCIETRVRRVLPSAVVREAPLHDGGKGFSRALVAPTSREMRHMTVMGPAGEPVPPHSGFPGGEGRPRTAVIDIAAVAGLALTARERRNPLLTTTYGAGELITAALDEGPCRIIVGCSDSGTCDGGIGMCQALGAQIHRRRRRGASSRERRRAACSTSPGGCFKAPSQAPERRDRGRVQLAERALWGQWRLGQCCHYLQVALARSFFLLSGELSGLGAVVLVKSGHSVSRPNLLGICPALPSPVTSNDDSTRPIDTVQ